VLQKRALRSTLGCPAQLLRRLREAIDHRRHRLPDSLQLRAGAVASHPNIVDNALHLLPSVPQSALPTAAPVDLVVAELPTDR
jgi:hypothetical protein